jgi:FlaA1/EpsC-like NDP-sugar epimerase
LKISYKTILPYKSFSLVLSDCFFGNVFFIYFLLNNVLVIDKHLMINIFNIILALIFGFYKKIQNTIDLNIFKNIFFILIPVNTFLLFIVYDNLFLSLFYSYLFWTSVIASRLIIIKLKRFLKNREDQTCMVIGCNMAARHVGRVLSDSPNQAFLGYIKTNDDNLIDQIDTYKVYNLKSIEKMINNKKLDLIYLPNDILLNIDEKKYIDNLNKKNLIIKNTKNIAQIVENTNDNLNLIDSLISRTEYKVKKKELSHFNNCNVLVTGAGGSIGSQLVGVLVENTNAKIFVLDNSERSLFELKQFVGIKSSRINFIIGDIRFIDNINFSVNPSTFNFIINAAAYKHVELVQNNYWEGFDVNYKGTQKLLNFRKKYKIYGFVQISTDKAVNPTTIMGLTKRLAELAVLTDEYKSKYSSEKSNIIVRFGNVIGSSGSVIPKFQNLIMNQKPITIYHKDLTRFMMTINEAVSLVLIASNYKTKKSIFLLDMGKEVSILELAKKMIIFNGFKPTFEKQKLNEIQIKFGTLPKHEKISEILYDNVKPENTSHPKIHYIQEHLIIDNIETVLSKLINLIEIKNWKKIEKLLKSKKLYF